MEKKKGKIKEVNEQYDIMLEGENKWITAIDKVKQYINESIKGKEVDLVIQDDKITFLKLLDDATQKANGNADLSEILKTLNHLNWNLGSTMKNQRLYYLFKMSEDYGETRNMVKRRIYEYFLNELGKDLKHLKQIREEQEK